MKYMKFGISLGHTGCKLLQVVQPPASLRERTPLLTSNWTHCWGLTTCRLTKRNFFCPFFCPFGSSCSLSSIPSSPLTSTSIFPSVVRGRRSCPQSDPGSLRLRIRLLLSHQRCLLHLLYPIWDIDGSPEGCRGSCVLGTRWIKKDTRWIERSSMVACLFSD